MLLSKFCKVACVSAAAILSLGSLARADIVSTIENAKSGTTVSVSGTYTVTVTIKVPSGVTVSGPATFVFNSTTNDGFSVPTGNSNCVFNSLTVTGANHGFMIAGGGCKVNSCVAENNHNTGFEISAAKAINNTFTNCQSYSNADSTGGNADGFGAKNGTGVGNTFSGCIAHNNSDDGWDWYGALQPISITNCQSYDEGAANGVSGNGDGFKMGSHENIHVSHSYTSCISHDNTAGDSGRGFNQNGNTAVITLTGCHSYNNKKVDVLTGDTLINCTMQT
jgi:hypothetical protein